MPTSTVGERLTLTGLIWLWMLLTLMSVRWFTMHGVPPDQAITIVGITLSTFLGAISLIVVANE